MTDYILVTFYGFGENLYNQLGINTIQMKYTEMETPILSTMTNIIYISTSGKHTLALTKNGKIYSFGNNNYYQLGRNNYGNNTPQLIPNLII